MFFRIASRGLQLQSRHVVYVVEAQRDHTETANTGKFVASAQSKLFLHLELTSYVELAALMSPSEPSKFAVYYDHSCPLCRKEIAFYQARAGEDEIEWVDVSRFENTPTGLTCQQAMSRFHVRTSEGELVDGGAAFAELWKQLPDLRWAGLIFSRAPGRWLANIAYDTLLPIRPFVQRLFRERQTSKDA